MEQERMRVLEMLAQGTIDTQQANELFEALEQPREPVGASTEWREAGRPRPERRSAVRSGNPSIRMLTEARMHGVTPEYIKEMREATGRQLSLEELIEMRAHGMSAAYLSEMRAHGFGNLPLQELMEMRMHGVTPEYVKEMQALGFTGSDSRHKSTSEDEAFEIQVDAPEIER